MTRTSFDALATRLAESPTTFSERELLELSHWSLGEDARLREDTRFRESPWGRWMLAENIVANDAVYRWLCAERRGAVALDAALKRAGEAFGRRCVFCGDDPRFVLRADEVRLAASELSRQPVVEDDVGDLEKYRTHLPLHGLKAAAASEPAGEWGKRAQHDVIETLGWVRVSLPGCRLNERMFIAAIEGHSMDNGKTGLVDGGYAIFELWPALEEKETKNVLVRGAFSDPETGSYAVKQYTPRATAPDGGRLRVTLRSLNPDEARYPPIEVSPGNAEDFAVVAVVIRALSTDDYERRPKPKRRVARRNLTVDDQAARLGRRVASFFDGTAPEADDEAADTATITGWQTRLVCLDVAAGGLQLEVGPLDGLPPFVKKLRVVGTEWDAVVLAANARTRSARLPARPGTGPWRWEAVGFEEEQDLGVERLALDALDLTAPMVFRVDADGVGQGTGSTTLAPGQAYRLLLPPKVGDDLGVELDGGWRIWSLDLSAPLTPTTRQALTALGLDVGEASPRLEWALAPAAAWRTNARGNSYPVFEAGEELLVNISGLPAGDGDDVALFLHGPAGTERLAVSTDGFVSLGKPPVGHWTCALLHSRVSVEPASLFFEVVEDVLDVIVASPSAVAHAGLPALEASAPPGWPVALRWRVFADHDEHLATVYANEEGSVPIDAVASSIEARAARTRMADLIVDFGELGHRVLPHDGRAALKLVREQLTDLWQKRSGLVQSRKGAWLQLRKPWFEPITELLGYGLEEATLLADVEAPHDLTAWGLTVDERIVGSITRSPARVLVLTTDVDTVLREHRAWIDGACSAAKVRDAIITDGARWTTHRKGSQQLKQQVWSLDDAIGLGNIDEMLGDLAEGL